MNAREFHGKSKQPPWLRRTLPAGSEYERVRRLLKNSCVHTVCQEAGCPNIWECFSQRIATFMILGAHCTRNCRFCGVATGMPEAPDPDEPARVADAVRTMGLSYVTLTSVTRDDLPDGGAGAFAETISRIRALSRVLSRKIRVEVLVPDFKGDHKALQKVLQAHPHVLNHNIETVPRLYPEVRPGADYRRSLDLLAHAENMDGNVRTKSGLMLGLGEKEDEIQNVLIDLLQAGCRILTLGQYLQPSRAHLPVTRFVRPEEFDCWRKKALAMGFSNVASGPFVRSSYHARELID